MPKLYEWPLPLNPPNFLPFYLRSLAPILPGEKMVYYSKYILGVIGELDPTSKTDNVREWTFPQKLSPTRASTTNIVRITRGPKRHIWFAAEEWRGFVGSLEPKTGILTIYLTQKIGDDPMCYPHALCFDGKGALWFLSYARLGDAIARLDLVTNRVRYWVIPWTSMGSFPGMLNSVSLSVNQAGGIVWVSSIDPNAGSTRAWFGKLDVAKNSFTTFRPQVPNLDSPSSMDVRVWEGASNPGVWFTAGNGSNSGTYTQRIYRRDGKTGLFHQYVIANDSYPRFIDFLDDTGSVAVSDLIRHSILVCNIAPSCGTLPFDQATVMIKPQSAVLERESRIVKPVISSSSPVQSTVSKNSSMCVDEFLLGTHPYIYELRVTNLGYPHSIFYINWGNNNNKIGALTP
jgi:hypothetical protein